MTNHGGIIILSFLLTIIIFAPLVAFPVVIKNEYQGININRFGTDTYFYLSRGKEVLDGHNLGNPLLREGKNEADAHSSYSEYLLLSPIKLLGLAQKLDIVIIYNSLNFIGIFFLLLLIYFFVLQLSGSKLLSIAAALFVVGGYSIIYNKTLFYDDFNVYARQIYPYVSSLILFAYLNLLVKSFKTEGLRYKIFAALTFGLLFYIYFFAWSFVLALNAVLLLIFVLKKDFLIAKKILLISLGGLLLGSYNLIQLFSFMLSEAGKQAAYFNWMSFSHGPIFSKIGFLVLIIFAGYYYGRRDDKNWPFLLALILSGWVALNQQIITGKMLQYGHYYWYFVVPLSIIGSFYMIWQLIERENLKKYLFIAVIVLVFINTAGGQYKSFFTTLEIKKHEQSYRPLIDFLNRTKNSSVILSGDESGEYLFTIYTPHDVFWQASASFGRLPIQRFKDVLFVYAYLNGEARNDFRGYLEKISRSGTEGSFYQDLYRNLEGYWSGYSYYDYNSRLKKNDLRLSQTRPAIIDQLSQEYGEAVLKNNGFEKLIKQYGIGYIVWDKNLNPEWDLGGLPGLKLVATSDDLSLYQINQE